MRVAPISAAVSAAAFPRTARAQASTDPPVGGVDAASRPWKGTPRRPASLRTYAASVGRARSQPVIEVEHREADLEEAAQVPQRIEQAHRIGSARHLDHHQVAGLQHVVRSNRGGDPFQHAGDGRRAPRQRPTP